MGSGPITLSCSLNAILGAEMTNGFLGAVRSLCGLMQLQKPEPEGAPLPDIVVFEYTLNDILLVSRNAISTILYS